MTKWSYKGKPMPVLSLLIIPFFISIHLLLTILFSTLFSFILEDISFYLLFWFIFLIITYGVRNIYLRLFFNLYIWLLKGNGNSLIERLIRRILKYCFLTFFVIPVILFIMQMILGQDSFKGDFWFLYIYSNFYLSLGLTIILAYLVEKFLSNEVIKKIDKIYSKLGPLMVEAEWQ